MAERNLPPVPHMIRPVTADGYLSAPWAAWFRQLFFRVGGHEALTNSELDLTLPSSVTTTLLADDAVTSAKLADHASTDASRAVTTNHVRDLAITAAKLGAGAVTAAKVTSYRTVTGSVASPGAVTAAGGIAPNGKADELMFLAGSGGHVDITANPQIAAGTAVGQRLALRVPSGSNGILIENGNGVSMNGPADLGVDTWSISFEWDGSVWVCTSRD